MLKKYTKNIYLDFFLNAADQLNIQYKFFSPFRTTVEFTHNKKSLIISNAVLGVNSEISASFAKNKYKTYRLLDQKNFPRPKATLIKKDVQIEEIFKAALKIPQPWVVKPIKGMGGSGVSVRVRGRDQLNKAVEFARQENEKIIIEEFVEGINFRILLFQGKILDITKRVPANVVGTGDKTIEELIKLKNKRRKKVGLKVIRVDQELERQLQLQKLFPTKILPKGKRVFLRQSCNMAVGGETIRIDKREVHQDNLTLFTESIRLLRLPFGGIDFITPDITKSYKEITCVINEINRAPSMDVHYFADMKMDNFVAETILKMYFNF